MVASNTMANDNQTVWNLISDSSFSTQDVLTKLTRGLSLDMNSVQVLMQVIKDNNLDGSDTMKAIEKVLKNMNNGGIDYRIRLNQILGYLYSFAEGNNKINGIVDMRKKDLNTIFSKPKSAI